MFNKIFIMAMYAAVCGHFAVIRSMEQKSTRCSQPPLLCYGQGQDGQELAAGYQPDQLIRDAFESLAQSIYSNRSAASGISNITRLLRYLKNRPTRPFSQEMIDVCTRLYPVDLGNILFCVIALDDEDGAMSIGEAIGYLTALLFYSANLGHTIIFGNHIDHYRNILSGPGPGLYLTIQNMILDTCAIVR